MGREGTTGGRDNDVGKAVLGQRTRWLPFKRDEGDKAVETGPLLALAVCRRKSPSNHFNFL